MIEAYEAGEVYGTKEFADRVYKSHRRVVGKVNGNFGGGRWGPWVLCNYIAFWLLLYVITWLPFLELSCRF